MFDFSKMQGLFGSTGSPQQNYGGLFQQMAGRYGGLPQTPLQGMGLGSPFFTERPQQALPTQGFTPTRDNAMGPNAMAMMGMNPNMPNMVGPTSALPQNMQPQQSQLKMWGMENQLAPPPAQINPQNNSNMTNGMFNNSEIENMIKIAIENQNSSGRMTNSKRFDWHNPYGL